MTPFAHIDQSDFPLVVVTYTGEKPTEENFPQYLEELTDVYRREAPFIIVFDAFKSVLPGLKYQRKQAQWMTEHLDLIEQYCLGSAFVIPQDIIRTVLKAIFAIQPPPMRYEIFATMEAGMAWAKSRSVSV